MVVFGLLVWLFGCGQQSRNVRVSGVFRNCVECKLVIGEPTEKGAEIIDTVYTNTEGKFGFETSAVSPKFITIQPSNSKEPIILLVNPKEKLELSISYENKRLNYSVTGSIGSVLVNDLNTKLKKVVEEIDTLSSHFKTNRNHEKFDSIKTVIDERYSFIIGQHRNYTINFIKANPFSLASILALNQQYSHNHYVLNKREDFALYQFIDSSLNTIYPTNPLVKAFHVKVANMAKQLNLYDRQQDMFAIGEYLPLPNLTLTNGDVVALGQLLGKYTLVDFWGTWCGNCLKNNLILKSIYEENYSKGFRIVQFAVDDNAEKVNAAVIADSIKWAIATDYKQWESPFLDELKINSIPSNYLIDRHGLIIDKNLTPTKLNDLLNKLLITNPAPVKTFKPTFVPTKVDTIR